MTRFKSVALLLFALSAALLQAGCEIPIGPPEERMFKCAKNDYERNMRKLLDQGISPNITDSAGWTPVMWAAAKDNVDTLGLLLDRGGYLEARNKKGETALHIAARWSRLDTVRYLISRGAKTEALDRLAWPPMMWAAMQGRTDVIKALAEGGANINFVDTNGNTPLMMAANRGRENTVRELLRLGVNTARTNKAGQRAADVARQARYPQLADIIEGREPAPPQKEKRGSK